MHEYVLDEDPFQRSSHAEFFRAVSRSGERVVVKALHSTSRRLRVMRENSDVRHGNILEIFDFIDLPDGLVGAVSDECELCEPRTLVELRELICDVKSALSFLHSNAIIHRQIDPRHILLFRGSWKLIDMSRAKRLNHEPRSPQNSSMSFLHVPAAEEVDWRLLAWTLWFFALKIEGRSEIQLPSIPSRSQKDPDLAEIGNLDLRRLVENIHTVHESPPQSPDVSRPFDSAELWPSTVKRRDLGATRIIDEDVMISAASLFRSIELKPGDLDWAQPWLDLDLFDRPWQGGLRCVIDGEAFVAEWEEGPAERLIIWRLHLCIIERAGRISNLDLFVFETEHHEVRGIEPMVKDFVWAHWNRLTNIRSELINLRDIASHGG